MMKYDFELELNNNNSLSRIIEQIRSDSVILEFGPATGRMTKYLKEKLGCKVYLSELDEEAGNKALQYGVDLVVGDIENYEWETKYRDIRFDYIIFADVLEHLRDPEQVLSRAKHLLKANGTILVSVPNMAHNSVMIELLNNRFEYTSTGLLDNTHIHMFTKTSLDNTVQRAGLNVCKRYATYCKPGTNEIINSIDDVQGIDRSYWLTREYGEVYQFVYVLKNGIEYVEEETNYLLEDSKNYYIQLFSGTCGVCEENSEKKYFRKVKGKQAVIFRNIIHGDSIRLDPLNGACICKIDSIRACVGGEIQQLKIIATNASYMRGEMLFFDTPDPIIELATPFVEVIDSLEIELEFIFIDEKIIKSLGNGLANQTEALSLFVENNRLLEQELVSSKRELGYMRVNAESANSEVNELKKELSIVTSKFAEQETELMDVRTRNEYLEKEVEILKAEKDALQSAYVSKDAYLEQMIYYKKGIWRKLFRKRKTE